jgi:hypothetical protein
MKLWILLGSASDDPDVYPNDTVRPGVTAEWQISDAVDNRSFSADTIKPLAVMHILDQIRTHNAKNGEIVEVVFPSEEELDFFLEAIVLQLRGDPISTPADFMAWVDNSDGVKTDIFPDAASDAPKGHFVTAFVNAVRMGANMTYQPDVAPADENEEMRP